MGQENLIPNAGFESPPTKVYVKKSVSFYNTEIYSCGQCNVGDTIAPGWFQPTAGTVDLMWGDSLGCGEVRSQGPYRGKGFMGIILYNESGYREYGQVGLKRPLEAGKTYHFECAIKRFREGQWKSGNVGVYFSEQPVRSEKNSNLEVMPQVEFCNGAILTSTKKWRKLSGTYMARGNEKFLTIGSFEPCASAKAYKAGVSGTYFDRDYFDKGYYLFDDFVLAEADEKTPTIKPNIIVLVDVSKSMFKSGYIQSLRDTLGHFMKMYAKIADITLISFGAKATIVWQSANGTGTFEMDSLLSESRAQNATLIDPALELAYATVDQTKVPANNTQVYLLSDGVFEFSKEAKKIITNHEVAKKAAFTFVQFGDKRNNEMAGVIEKSHGKYVLIHATTLSKELVSKQRLSPGCDCR